MEATKDKKHGRKRRQHTDEFKAGAECLVAEGKPAAEVARDLGQIWAASLPAHQCEDPSEALPVRQVAWVG